MNTAVYVVMLVTLLLVAVLMAALPSMMPRTVPLGVNVPSAKRDEPVIRRALRWYRILVAASWPLAVLVLTLLVRTTPIAAALVSELVLIAGSVVAYVLARQKILRAKRDGGWYAGVPVRIAADISADGPRNPVPVGWFVASLVLLVSATAVGIAVYDTLPASIPTHWGVGGAPDRFDPKSIWTVFGPLIIAAIVVLGLFALSFLTRIVPVRAMPSATAEENAARENGIRSATSSLLGRLMFAIALGLSWTVIGTFLFPSAHSFVSLGILLMIALILASVIGFIVEWRRAISAVDRAGTPDAPDEDRYWKAGILYLNKDDPAIVVQRRFGAGWTINLGHPAGIAIGVGFVLLIVGVVVFALTAHLWL